MSGAGKGKAKSKAHVDAKLKDLNKKERQHLRDSEFYVPFRSRTQCHQCQAGPILRRWICPGVLTNSPEYCMNSLESIIWQPHFNQFLGIDIDLVDQDSSPFKRKNEKDFGDLESRRSRKLDYISLELVGRELADGMLWESCCLEANHCGYVILYTLIMSWGRRARGIATTKEIETVDIPDPVRRRSHCCFLMTLLNTPRG